MGNKGFTIITDTREQQPLLFSGALIDDIIVRKLDTGDYSIAGMEDELCIERKGSLMEFYGNISEKRFWAEMERMKVYKHRFLILEFSVSDVEQFPYSLNLPEKIKAKLTITAQYLMRCISEIQVKYGVHVVFAENRSLATYVITNIMKRVNESRQ